MPGRDTALGFLLRRTLVAKDYARPRRLLRFCNVGSFPQNGLPAPQLPRHSGGGRIWQPVTPFQGHVRAKSGKRACALRHALLPR